MAGTKAVSSGPEGEGFAVTTVDLNTGSVRQIGATEGEPLGLAAAEGRLFVATTTGELTLLRRLCHKSRFAVGPFRSPESPAFQNLAQTEAYADEIIARTSVTEGYCLIPNCADAALAAALAKKTNLQIYAFDADPEKVADARQRLDVSGLYGTRVTVMPVENFASLPDYVADLVICRTSPVDAASDMKSEIDRILRPFGGVACLGAADSLKSSGGARSKAPEPGRTSTAILPTATVPATHSFTVPWACFGSTISASPYRVAMDGVGLPCSWTDACSSKGSTVSFA